MSGRQKFGIRGFSRSSGHRNRRVRRLKPRVRIHLESLDRPRPAQARFTWRRFVARSIDGRAGAPGDAGASPAMRTRPAVGRPGFWGSALSTGLDDARVRLDFGPDCHCEGRSPKQSRPAMETPALAPERSAGASVASSLGELCRPACGTNRFSQ